MKTHGDGPKERHAGCCQPNRSCALSLVVSHPEAVSHTLVYARISRTHRPRSDQPLEPRRALAASVRNWYEPR